MAVFKTRSNKGCGLLNGELRALGFKTHEGCPSSVVVDASRRAIKNRLISLKKYSGISRM